MNSPSSVSRRFGDLGNDLNALESPVTELGVVLQPDGSEGASTNRSVPAEV